MSTTNAILKAGEDGKFEKDAEVKFLIVAGNFLNQCDIEPGKELSFL